jgi:hypothetical protein
VLVLQFAFCDVKELDVAIVVTLTDIKSVRRDSRLQACYWHGFLT